MRRPFFFSGCLRAVTARSSAEIPGARDQPVHRRCIVIPQLDQRGDRLGFVRLCGVVRAGDPIPHVIAQVTDPESVGAAVVQPVAVIVAAPVDLELPFQLRLVRRPVHIQRQVGRLSGGEFSHPFGHAFAQRVLCQRVAGLDLLGVDVFVDVVLAVVVERLRGIERAQPGRQRLGEFGDVHVVIAQRQFGADQTLSSNVVPPVRSTPIA